MEWAAQVGDPGRFPNVIAGIGCLITLALGYVFLRNPGGLGVRMIQLWVNGSPFRDRMAMSPAALAKIFGAVFLFLGCLMIIPALQGIL
ncbi:hypothetical protein HHX38_26195 [Streptomyces sp. PKU-MA01144]|uniref:hypothetical protein n=1 Tax=Streptomyces sp. PKU-MA01144 TaxID=2729138 RepID=UPI00147E4A36|nr:hypothetical protein [Streptomyces sp. PKU-MA01144]NNJ07594.1 hypothetical protein [Streptomyces sp. PKU-MA01144]